MVAGLPLAGEGGAMTDDRRCEAERHRAKMAKRKAVQDAEVAGKTDREGPPHRPHRHRQGQIDRRLRPRAAHARPRPSRRRGAVHQGRLAHRRARRARELRRPVSWHTMGEGFTWETQDRARDVAAAERPGRRPRRADGRSELRPRRSRRAQHRAALRLSRPRIASSPRCARAADLHVVVTGRNAKPELIEAADLVTEMTLVKHHFAAGVKAQAGIEF